MEIENSEKEDGTGGISMQISKKILICAATAGLLTFGLMLRSALNPVNGIKGISQESGKNYREWIVLRNDGTFEQIVQDNRTQKTFCNQGTWIQAADDPETRLFLARTEAKIDVKYFDLKNEVEVPDPLTVASWRAPAGSNSALLPGISFSPPDAAQLQVIEALCKNAVPMK